MIGQELEKYTFEYLLQTALNHVPSTVDKRQGSVIYDALAPACYVLSDYFMSLRNFYKDTFAMYATGEALDLRVAERGLVRYEATFAEKMVVMYGQNDTLISAPIGSRFSTISDGESLNYTITAQYKHNGAVIKGAYVATCETAGIIGNEYSGNLISISFVPGLVRAVMTELVTPARDEETDDELRARYFESLTQKPFGGNIAQYTQVLKAIDGVGAVQVYPIWNGGGTVKCSIIDTEYNPVSSAFLQSVQEQIDPPEGSGNGLGLAPIGHKVTMDTPQALTINISALLSLDEGYDLETVTPVIEENIDDYLLSLRKQWGVAGEMNEHSLAVYHARIIAAILDAPGVSNVQNLLINGDNEDLILQETAELQQIPVLGTVTLNV